MKKSRNAIVWALIIVILAGMAFLGLAYKKQLHDKEKQATADIQRQITPVEDIDTTIQTSKTDDTAEIKKIVSDFLKLTEQFDYQTYSKIEMGYEYMTDSLAVDIKKKMSNVDQMYTYGIEHKQQLTMKSLTFLDVKKEAEEQSDRYNYLVKTKAVMELRESGKLVATYTTAYNLVLVMADDQWKIYKIQTQTLDAKESKQ